MQPKGQARGGAIPRQTLQSTCKTQAACSFVRSQAVRQLAVRMDCWSASSAQDRTTWTAGTAPSISTSQGGGGRLAAQKHTWGCYWQKPLDHRTKSIIEIRQHQQHHTNLHIFVTESDTKNEKKSTKSERQGRQQTDSHG